MTIKPSHFRINFEGNTVTFSINGVNQFRFNTSPDQYCCVSFYYPRELGFGEIISDIEKQTVCKDKMLGERTNKGEQEKIQ